MKTIKIISLCSVKRKFIIIARLSIFYISWTHICKQKQNLKFSVDPPYKI